MKDNLTNNDKNEFPDISVYNNESISKIKSLLSQDLLKQEKYIKMIKTSIMNTNSGKKESLSKLNQMLEMFSEIVRFIGITFCEIIKKDEKFLEEMFKLLLNKKMKKKCEQIILYKFIIFPLKEKISAMSSEIGLLNHMQIFPFLKKEIVLLKLNYLWMK